MKREQGFGVELQRDDDAVIAIVSNRRKDKAINIFRGTVAEALRQAWQASLDAGLDGHYEINGLEVLQPVKLATHGGVIDEINRQLELLRPKSGVRWGFNLPPLSGKELAEIPPTQAQISRLVTLRNAVTKQPVGVSR